MRTTKRNRKQAKNMLKDVLKFGK